MKFDCMNIPIRDHDCVVELTDEFAKYGADGSNLNYGIVYGSKWILPLDGSRKKQLDVSEYVKVLNKELPPEIRDKLYALYAYYKKYQILPGEEENVSEIMEEELRLERERQMQKRRPISPFEKDATSSKVQWCADQVDDDLI